jgi:hypothetical protein
MKLSIKSFALASGILWAVIVFLATIFIMLRGGGEHLILLNKFFYGYSISFVGAIIGLVYAFISGLILGALFACIHNWFAK